MNSISQLIKNMEKKDFPFKPCTEFYFTTKINPKRWGMIYRNEISPTIEEFRAVCKYFNIKPEEVIKD